MKLIGCLFFLLIATAAHAQIAHDLTVYSEDGAAFTLLVNGQKINEGPAASVTASNINFDHAKVVVQFQDANIPQIERRNL